ncbi:unnamed protein product, partial [Iphiclides podalirius]
MIKRKLVFINSRRGNPLILLSGYTYSVKAIKKLGANVKRRWHCSTHNARGCRANLCTIDGEIIMMKTNHNHDPVHQ